MPCDNLRFLIRAHILPEHRKCAVQAHSVAQVRLFHNVRHWPDRSDRCFRAVQLQNHPRPQWPCRRYHMARHTLHKTAPSLPCRCDSFSLSMTPVCSRFRSAILRNCFRFDVLLLSIPSRERAFAVQGIELKVGKQLLIQRFRRRRWWRLLFRWTNRPMCSCYVSQTPSPGKPLNWKRRKPGVDAGHQIDGLCTGCQIPAQLFNDRSFPIIRLHDSIGVNRFLLGMNPHSNRYKHDGWYDTKYKAPGNRTIHFLYHCSSSATSRSTSWSGTRLAR